MATAERSRFREAGWSDDRIGLGTDGLTDESFGDFPLDLAEGRSRRGGSVRQGPQAAAAAAGSGLPTRGTAVGVS
jgi:hypothetical protein